MTENELNNEKPVEAEEPQPVEVEDEPAVETAEAEPEAEEAAEAEEEPSGTAKELAELNKEDKPKRSVANIVHWIIHIVFALIIICFIWLCFTGTGKLVQNYGLGETLEAKSSYSGSQWEEAGFEFEEYMYYYDMYASSYEEYKDQYAAMGMESMDDLMDSLFQMLQGTFMTDQDGAGAESADSGEGE